MTDPSVADLDLDKVELLRGLDVQTRELIVSALQLKHYEAGDVVFSKGSEGNSLYFVQQGVMNVVAGQDTADPAASTSYIVDQVLAGSVFGEMALLLSMPRTATICADSTAVVLELQRKDFEAAAARSAVLNERLQAIKELRFLRFRQDLEQAVLHPDRIDAKQKAYVTEVFKQIDTDGSGAIDQDELAVMLTRLAGRFYSKEQVTAMMTMLDKDGNGSIDVQEFLAGLPLLAKWLVRSTDEDTDELDLEQVKLLQGIDASTRFQIIMALKKRTFSEGELVFTKGSKGRSLFFLQRGVMDVVVGDGNADPTNPVLTCVCVDQIHAGSVFGELAILLSMPRTATISVASKRAVAYELERADFEAAAASSCLLQERLDVIKEERFARFRHGTSKSILDDFFESFLTHLHLKQTSRRPVFAPKTWIIRVRLTC